MKERLTGAVILVALIVLLVPELLTGPIRSAPRAVAASAEEPPLRSYTINLADEARAHGAANAASGPQPPAPLPPTPAAASPQAPPPQQDTAAPQPQAAPPPPPAAAAPPQAAPPAAARTAAPHVTKKEFSTRESAAVKTAAPATGALMVQLGSFASRANAERLARQVKAKGFTVSVSRGTTGRHLYRVQVGPVSDHAEAAQLEGKLRAAGHSGSIVAN